MRVLVVEDEEYLAEAIATGLRREAMAVDVVATGPAPWSTWRPTTTTSSSWTATCP